MKNIFSIHPIVISFMLAMGCAKQPPNTLDILFEGDSDIELWNTEEYPNSKNVGLGGDTCQDVLDLLDTTLASNPTQNVVLVCGENDFPDRSAYDTFVLFKSIVEKIHGSGAHVYYMGTKPEPDTTSLHQMYRDYDNFIKEYAIAHANTQSPYRLTVIDVYNGFVELDNPNELYAEDQLHLSEAGYAYWNEWLQKAQNNSSCSIWRSGVCIHE